MKIAVCETKSGTGNFLTERLVNEGFDIAFISREDIECGVQYLKQLLNDIDVVINLCGNEIVRKWTSSRKERIYNSHVRNTRLLVKTINGLERKPSLFITLTLVNIYDNVEIHDEFSQNFATDFLGDFCRNWEQEVFKINPEVKYCIFRSGFVLDKNKAYFQKLLKYFKWGFGKKIGNGKQPFPFIHIKDVVNIIVWSIKNKEAEGIYNMVAPEVVTNAEFYAALSNVLKRRAFFSITNKMIESQLGEASEIFTTGKFVLPHRLLSSGYEFIYPTLKEGLEEILGS